MQCTGHWFLTRNQTYTKGHRSSSFALYSHWQECTNYSFTEDQIILNILDCTVQWMIHWSTDLRESLGPTIQLPVCKNVLIFLYLCGSEALFPSRVLVSPGSSFPWWHVIQSSRWCNFFDAIKFLEKNENVALLVVSNFEQYVCLPRKCCTFAAEDFRCHKERKRKRKLYFSRLSRVWLDFRRGFVVCHSSLTGRAASLCGSCFFPNLCSSVLAVLCCIWTSEGCEPQASC